MPRTSPLLRSPFAFATFAAAALGSGFLAAAEPAAPRPGGDGKVDFLRDVRPILSQHCFQCHGPDDATRKAKLRLDRKEEAFAERKEKHVIAPGSLEGSLVWDRITTDNAKRQMPPPDKAEALSEKKRETLRRWIEEGAPWSEHWAFVAPKKTPAPAPRAAAWARDPMDLFVLAKMEEAGLEPNAEAAKEAWIRRASFDLTGLPPTPAELDEFLKDKSPASYEKVVDRLLASPRYGERQAQEWLDLARYADTGGYQNDSPRQVWKWRDWVVSAFNENKPYDQFVVEQLAGDLLPNATLAQKVATGFNRNHPTNSEAGEEPDEYRTAYVVDRVNTTATALLGLTMACAQCHDHKYDPISQRDYYQFFAFFNDVKERDSDGFGMRNPRPSIPVPNPDQEPRLKDVQARIEKLKGRLDREDPLADADQKEWETRSLERLGAEVAWTTPEPVGMIARNGSLLKRLEDGSILSTGPTPVKDTYELVLQPGKRKIQALRLEVIPDESQPKGSSGRATDGRFILSNLEVRNSTLSESQEPPVVVFAKGDADLNQKKDPLEDIDTSGEIEFPSPIDSALEVMETKGPGGNDGGGGRMGGGGWTLIEDAKKARHEAILLPREPLEMNDSSVLRVAMHHASQAKFKSLVGRFRISFTEDPRVREILLPVTAKAWSAVGPFAAEDVERAWSTEFAPEKEIAKGLDLKKTYEKVVLAAPDAKGADGKAPPDGKAGAAAKGADGKGAAEGKPAAEAKDSDGAKPGATDAKKPSAEEKAPATAQSEAAKNEPKEEESGDDAKPAKAPPKGPGKGGAVAADGSGAEGAKGPEPAPGEAGTQSPKKDGPPASPADGKPPEGKKFPKGGFGKFAKPEGSPEGKGTGPKGDGPAGGGDEQGANGKKDAKVAGSAPEKDAKDPKDPKKDGDKDEKDGERGRQRKPEKLAWQERPNWREGGTQRFEGANSVWYLARKLVSTAPRTAMLRLDGPEAYKVWLNGEPVHATAAPTAKKETKKPDEEDDFAIFLAMTGRGTGEEKKFRLGLRQGENELVVKVVFGGGGGGRSGFGGGMAAAAGGPPGMGGPGAGGGSVTFDLTPEGDDLLNHEVATALRLEAAERTGKPVEPAAGLPRGARAASGLPSGTAGEEPAASKPDEPKAPAKVDEPKAPAGDDAKKTLTPAEQRKKVIREFYRSKIDPVGRTISEELDRLKAEETKLKREIPETMVMEDRAKPRETHVLKRGHYKNKGDVVTAAAPSVLPPLAADLPKNRLGLARWVVSTDNPLAARVRVNRIWQQYFGLGLVRTAEDFGIRGELPSHPELLDALAADFMESKWDEKALHRRIVLSATYRQSAQSTPEKLEKDPENRLLARGPRLRLTAEMIRDNALDVSGLLVEKLGGESVKPFQPETISSNVTGGRPVKRDTNENQYRRAVYVYWKRGSPYPSMLTFDAAKRDTCTVIRPQTTTPLQALTLLNDPVYVECAKRLGQRMLKEGGKDDAARLRFGFRLCASRAPNAKETEALDSLLRDQRKRYKDAPEAAKKLLAVGDAKVDEKLDAGELAAWASVGNALLNLDATIHRG